MARLRFVHRDGPSSRPRRGVDTRLPGLLELIESETEQKTNSYAVRFVLVEVIEHAFSVGPIAVAHFRAMARVKPR